MNYDSDPNYKVEASGVSDSVGTRMVTVTITYIPKNLTATAVAMSEFVGWGSLTDDALREAGEAMTGMREAWWS